MYLNSLSLGVIGLGCLLVGAAIAVGLDWVRRRQRAAVARQNEALATLIVEKQAAQRQAEVAQRKVVAAELEAAQRQARADELANLLLGPTNEKKLKEHWGVVEAAERLTSMNLRAAEASQVASAHLENAMLYAEWLHARGNPKAPWPEIVRWKNEQKGQPQ